MNEPEKQRGNFYVRLNKIFSLPTTCIVLRLVRPGFDSMLMIDNTMYYSQMLVLQRVIMRRLSYIRSLVREQNGYLETTFE